MKEVVLSTMDRRAFERARRFARDWAREHGAEVGVVEIGLAAGALALGVHNGVLEMGRDLVASALTRFNWESGVGSALGSSAGAGAGAILGSIGIAAGGSAIGIPAGVLIGAGALGLGALGYSVGDVIHNYLHPSIDPTQLFANASLLVVATALLIDGARRIAQDKRVRASAATIRNGVLRLPAVEVVARSVSELQAWGRAHPEILPLATPATGTAVVVAAGAGGVAAGTALAAGSVTVLGSHALGAAALSLGLVSAPVWPVFAGAAVSMGLGYAAWAGVRRAINKAGDS